MKILIHDLPTEANEALFAGKFDDYKIFSDDGSLHACIGCMSCWYDKPGVCAFDDLGSRFSESLLECTELVIISACTFGSVSPFIKILLDRTRPQLLPNAEIRNNEVNYRPRSRERMKIRACFYGPENDDYEKTAIRFMKLFAGEWDTDQLTVEFYEDPSQIRGEGSDDGR